MGVKIIAGRASRAERIYRRRTIVLDDAALSPKTQTRYYLALRKLMPYFEKMEFQHELDDLMCAWVRRMWRTGEPLLTVGDGLSALHFFQPWTKRLLPHAWKLFGVWRKVELPARAPPLTQRICRSMAAYCLSVNDVEMAACLLLGFHCLLRTGEIFQLTFSDFRLGEHNGIVSLKVTKTGQRHGVHEALAITDMPTLECVRTLRSLRRQQGLSSLPLWSGSGAKFRQRFAQLVAIFDLQSHQFRPYSLRRGGATHMFQESKSMEAALLRGRWNSSRVAKLYISDALSYLPSLNMSTTTRHFLSTFYLVDLQQG
eukprot:Skav213413  [mRNA]  locus=scaffold797:806923:807864:- [translate_table: standard]